jgi:hypothetical protein
MPERFEQVVLPHLDAAYNLARWLMRSPADAEDAVQEACLRALRFFDGFSRRRQPGVASKDRSKYVLFVPAKEPPGGNDRRIR